MCDQHCVDLGFATIALPAGNHICQIYSDAEERDVCLKRYLLAGLQTGERNACFSDRLSRDEMGNFLGEHGIDMDKAEHAGSLIFAPTRDVYFQDNRFEPERMLGMLTKFHEDSVSGGYTSARVIGEMSPAINRIPGGSRLMEYESRVNMLLRSHPITAVCQYHAPDFSGETLMDVLKVHPMMVIRGNVVMNPFFVTPEKLLNPQP